MDQEEYGHYWKTILETMADGLMVVDTDGVIVDVNPAMEQISGFSSEELIGSPCTILRCNSCARVRGKGNGKYCALFEDGRVQGWRCTLRRKNGEPRQVMKNARVLTDESGKVVGGVETMTDLGEVEEWDRLINRLRRELFDRDGYEGMLGRSKAMRRVFELSANVAGSDAPVVVLGESGTGKELMAKAIHGKSARKDKPFVAVNCAALNEQLLESELFGHVKGAFTGADRSRVGRFEAARGGSIFLDEIGDMPPSIQVKLLRVLQEGEIERVGDHHPIRVDARIITATNKDLGRLMEEGRFRSDLYYRIGVVTIGLPPLRERAEDIPLLVDAFVSRMQVKTGKPITGLDKEAMDALMRHPWPGNVRELINAIEFLFIVCPGGEASVRHLPPGIAYAPPAPKPPEERPAVDPRAGDPDHILETLRQAGGNKSEAARRLGISRVTLWKRLKSMEEK